MPERPSVPLEPSAVVGEPISSSVPSRGTEAAGTETDNGAAERNEAKRGSSTPASRPVLPLSPTPPPQPGEAAPVVPPTLDTQRAEAEGGRWWSWLFSRETASWLVSCLFHASLLLILGLIAAAARPGSPSGSLVAYMVQPVPLEELIDELEGVVEVPKPEPVFATAALRDRELVVPDVALPPDESFPADDRPGVGFGLEPSRPVQWLLPADTPVGGGLEGRGREARARLVGEGGGTPESEAAVERGLRWLYTYQRGDGSWNFDHNKGRQSGFCPNPGSVASTTGATAIALAPFLGAGYTHLDGEYQDTVRRGLYYLTSRGLVTPDGVDLQEGTMYAQGLAAIVLCEAYAMTGDPGLKDVAQGALDFIDYAQDKRGGGWRYSPGQPGDTTVTGWQLMALKSGQMANLQVHSPTIFLACDFLDSVACEDGARYGYMTTDPRKTTTSIGLLCRMYTGWKRSNPGLKIGVQYLSEWGPAEDNIYYDYYATQVVRHWGGPEWQRWNPPMRDYLIATQARQGPEAGSWHFAGGHGETGGRLYNTAMAIMTLEVYYRYMPLYRQKAFDE